MTLARKAGIDPLKMIEVVQAGAGGSWQLANLGPRMLARDFAPGFMIKLLRKDLRLALAASSEVAQPLPVTALVFQLVHAVVGRGRSDAGTQALITVLETLGGADEEGSAPG